MAAWLYISRGEYPITAVCQRGLVDGCVCCQDLISTVVSLEVWPLINLGSGRLENFPS
jgi:hypothetical protein